MKDDFIELELELMYIIVNYGLGSKIIKYAKNMNKYSIKEMCFPDLA